MRISVNCPSYKRPKVETLEYLPFCRVWIDPAEEEAYREANPKADIVVCDPGVQGNLCRVRNHIIDREFERGIKAVLIIDDDMRGLYSWNDGEARKIETDEFRWIVEKYSIMAQDVGAYFWGVNCYPDRKAYREYTPFSTRSYIGGPFQCFIKDGGLRYDERLPLKEDYDMTLQQLNKHRVVLRVNRLHYQVKQSEQSGGCATYRNFEREREQFRLLQRKWGSKIVQTDSTSKRTKAGGEKIDYNPVLKVPIRGV